MIISLDFETSKLPNIHPWMVNSFPVAVGIKSMCGEYWSWIFQHNEELNPPPLKDIVYHMQLIINAADVLVGHHLKFDLNWLNYLGVDTSKVKLHCTQVAEYLIRGQQTGHLTLAEISNHYGIPPKKDKIKMFWDSGYETDEIPLSILNPYLEQDCINPLVIYAKQVEQIKKLGLSKLVLLQNELLRVLSDIECNGMSFNKAKADEIVYEYTNMLNEQQEELNILFGEEVKLTSGDELSAILFGGIIKREGKEKILKKYKHHERWVERKCIHEIKVDGVGFVPPKGSELKKEGYFATNKDTIKQLVAKTPSQKRIKALLLERSKVQKVLETLQGKEGDDEKGLINKVQLDGMIHPKYNQTVTKTGRLSSQDPNGQNFPRGNTSPIKTVFYPAYDYIMNADLSQIEWRGAGYLSQDPVIIQEILDGVDAHSDNAINILGINPVLQKQNPELFKKHRTDAKVVTFRLLYGGSAYAFYKDQNMPNYSLKKWEDIVEKFYSKYYGLADWQLCNIQTVNRCGQLRLPTGRILKFNRIKNKDGSIGYREQQIKNYPVQALATADIMPLAMVVISKRYKKYGIKSKIIAQVHDAIVHDVMDRELKTMSNICMDVFNSLPKLIEKTWGFKFNVPLTGEIEVGPNYGDLKKYKM